MIIMKSSVAASWLQASSLAVNWPRSSLSFCFLSIFAASASTFAILFNYFVKSEQTICAGDDVNDVNDVNEGHRSVDWSRIEPSNKLGDDIGDAFLADVGIARIYQEGGDLLAFAKLSDFESCSGLKFYENFSRVPSWIDMEKVNKGFEFQRLWITNIIGGGLGAILESYGHSNGANILVETGRLSSSCGEDVSKRLIETAWFNILIIRDGVNPGSEALDVIARVRMLHCMVRMHIRQASKAVWDVETMGCPVSQKDGLHTIFLNSSVTIRGLELQGIPVSDEDKDYVSMSWAYVGYLLGINEEFLPRSYEEEIRLYRLLLRKSFSPTEVSFKLVNATLEGSCDMPPFHLNLRQQTNLARFTLGPRIADRLKLAPTSNHWQDKMLMFLIRVSGFGSWLLYRLFNPKRFIFDIEWIVSITMDALNLYCKGKPQWRLYLASKNKNKNQLRGEK